jgi:hypothetical protein
VTLQEALDALADAVRRSILRELSAEPDFTRPCGSFDLPVSKATASHHFAVLRATGLLEQADGARAGSTGCGARSSTRVFPACSRWCWPRRRPDLSAKNDVSDVEIVPWKGNPPS